MMRWVANSCTSTINHWLCQLFFLNLAPTRLDAKAMDYHQKALNIQKSGSGVAKAMTAETCVLMGMVKSKLSEFQSALDVRSNFSIVVYYLSIIY
jgi:hypothetical protein